MRKRYKQYIIPSTSYAPMWKRLMASVVDFSILAGIFFFANLVQYEEPFRVIDDDLKEIVIISFLYYIPQLISERKATIGMRLFGFKIYMSNLEKVGFWTLIGRYCSIGLLGSLVFIIGSIILSMSQEIVFSLQLLFLRAPSMLLVLIILHLLIIALSRKKQALHDMISKTVCINNK